MTSKINIDGKDYDLKKIEDRSVIIKILKEKMKDVKDNDYIEVKGDFEIGRIDTHNPITAYKNKYCLSCYHGKRCPKSVTAINCCIATKFYKVR